MTAPGERVLQKALCFQGTRCIPCPGRATGSQSSRQPTHTHPDPSWETRFPRWESSVNSSNQGIVMRIQLRDFPRTRSQRRGAVCDQRRRGLRSAAPWCPARGAVRARVLLTLCRLSLDAPCGAGGDAGSHSELARGILA